jgi:hypothetical protein
MWPAGNGTAPYLLSRLQSLQATNKCHIQQLLATTSLGSSRAGHMRFFADSLRALLNKETEHSTCRKTLPALFQQPFLGIPDT